jgi:hypothetical protein
MYRDVVKLKLALALSVIGLASAVVPMFGHHSVEGQYDIDKLVTIQGVVTKIVWVNPHARLWLDTDRTV